MRLSTLLPLLGLFAFGYAERCSRRASSPGKEILCYTSSNDADKLIDSVCECTTLVHQWHDLYNLSIAGVEKLQKTLKEANPNLQVVITVSDAQGAIRTSGTSRQEAMGRLASLVNQVDGVELSMDAGSKERTTHFIKGLKDEMIRKSIEKRIIVALPTLPENLAKHYDLKALAKYVDLFTLRTDYLFDTTDPSFNTFHPSRLMGIFDMYNTDSLVDLISGMGVPKEKLLVSLPATAYKFTLADKDKNTPGSPAKKGDPEWINQKELCDLMSAGEWTVERDEDLTAPYAFKDSTWISYEDKTSIGIKGKYVLLRQLAGLAVHDVENDVKNDCGKTVTHEVYRSFTDMKRKTRGAVLASLENDLQHAQEPQSRNVRSSGFRIVRIVDTAGAIHAIRENTQTEFVCTRQGYFVHPKSCNRFYRCVKFDQGVDDYSVFEFDCPAGLAFDERTEVCVWPGSLTEGSPCPGSSEIAPVPRSRFQCPARHGYYADRENCRWFFACFDLGEREMAAYEFRCPFGLVFDEQKLICEWPWLVPNCGAAGYSRTEYGGSGSGSGSGSGYATKLNGYGSGSGHGSLPGGIGVGGYAGGGTGAGTMDGHSGSRFESGSHSTSGAGIRGNGAGNTVSDGYSGSGNEGSSYSGNSGLNNRYQGAGGSRYQNHGAGSSADGDLGGFQFGAKFPTTVAVGSGHSGYSGETGSTSEYNGLGEAGVVVETQGNSGTGGYTGSTGSAVNTAGNSGYNGFGSTATGSQGFRGTDQGDAEDGLTVFLQTGGAHGSHAGATGSDQADNSGYYNGNQADGNTYSSGATQSGYSHQENSGYVSSGESDSDSQDVINGGSHSGSNTLTTGNVYTGGSGTGGGFTSVTKNTLNGLDHALNVFGVRKPGTAGPAILVQTVTPGYAVTGSGISHGTVHGGSFTGAEHSEDGAYETESGYEAGNTGSGNVVINNGGIHNAGYGSGTPNSGSGVTFVSTGAGYEGGNAHREIGSSNTVSNIGTGGVSTGTTTYHGNGGSSSSYSNSKTNSYSNANSHDDSVTLVSHGENSGMFENANAGVGSVYEGSSRPGVILHGTSDSGAYEGGQIHDGGVTGTTTYHGNTGSSGSYQGERSHEGGIAGTTTYHGNTGSSGSYQGSQSHEGGVAGTTTYHGNTGSSGSYQGSQSHEGGVAGTTTYHGNTGSSGSYQGSQSHEGGVAGTTTYHGNTGSSGSYQGSQSHEGGVAGTTTYHGSTGSSGSYQGGQSHEGGVAGTTTYHGNTGSSGSYQGGQSHDGGFTGTTTYHGNTGSSGSYEGGQSHEGGVAGTTTYHGNTGSSGSYQGGQSHDGGFTGTTTYHGNTGSSGSYEGGQSHEGGVAGTTTYHGNTGSSGSYQGSQSHEGGVAGTTTYHGNTGSSGSYQGGQSHEGGVVGTTTYHGNTGSSGSYQGGQSHEGGAAGTTTYHGNTGSSGSYQGGQSHEGGVVGTTTYHGNTGSSGSYQGGQSHEGGVAGTTTYHGNTGSSGSYQGGQSHEGGVVGTTTYHGNTGSSGSYQGGQSHEGGVAGTTTYHGITGSSGYAASTGYGGGRSQEEEEEGGFAGSIGSEFGNKLTSSYVGTSASNSDRGMGYKTNEYESNGGRGTVTFNNGNSASKFTESDLREQPAYASLPDTIVSGGRIENSGGVVLGNTLAGTNSYSSGYGFSKTGGSSTGFQNTQTGGSGSHVTDAGYSHSTLTTGSTVFGGQTSIGHDVNNLAYVTSTVSSDVSHIDTSKINLGHSTSDEGSSGYTYSRPTVQLTGSTPAPLPTTYHGPISPLTVTTPSSYLNVETVYNTPTIVTSAPITAAPAVVNTYSYRKPAGTSSGSTASDGHYYSDSRFQTGSVSSTDQTSGHLDITYQVPEVTFQKEYVSSTLAPKTEGYTYEKPTKQFPYNSPSTVTPSVTVYRQPELTYRKPYVSPTPAPNTAGSGNTYEKPRKQLTTYVSPSTVSPSVTIYDQPEVTVNQQVKYVPEYGHKYEKPSVSIRPAISRQPTNYRKGYGVSSTAVPASETQGYGYSQPAVKFVTSTVAPCSDNDGGSPTRLDIPQREITKLVNNYNRGGMRYTPPDIYVASNGEAVDSGNTDYGNKKTENSIRTKTYRPTTPDSVVRTNSYSRYTSTTGGYTSGSSGYNTGRYGSTPLYEVSTVKSVSQKGKGKVIVKLSDLHPLLLGKLGAQCTCRSDPFETLRGPGAKIIKSSRGDIDLAQYDESQIYVDLETDSEPNRPADVHRSPNSYGTSSSISYSSPTSSSVSYSSPTSSSLSYPSPTSSSISYSSRTSPSISYSSPTSPSISHSSRTSPSISYSSPTSPSISHSSRTSPSISYSSPTSPSISHSSRTSPSISYSSPTSPSISYSSPTSSFIAHPSPTSSAITYTSPSRTPVTAVFGLSTAAPQVSRSRGTPSTARLPVAATGSAIGYGPRDDSSPRKGVPVEKGGYEASPGNLDPQYIDTPAGFVNRDFPSGNSAAGGIKSGKFTGGPSANGNAIGGAGAAFDRYGPGGLRGVDETLQGTTDCARPGLFRHPKLCNKFYACHWDEWKQRYTLHVFNCPVHLSFDSNAGACNWPSKGPACQDDNLLI